ncbi:MAG: carboxypeptidase-like regulatory domain-containing protein [Thalassolituus sp.]
MDKITTLYKQHRTPVRSGFLHNAAPRALLCVMLSSVLLSGCSSSSDSGSPAAESGTGTAQAPANTQAVSGTAAIGAAITDGTVTAICADGSSFTESVTTDAHGNWSGEVANGAMPCALQVTGGNPPVTLHSYVSAPGTVNITPLTDLIMASATGQSPADWFANFDGTTLDTATASTDLLNSFAAKGFTIPATGNPMTTPFAADGSGWDGLLDDIGDAIENDPAIADYDALMTLVKDGNLANIPAPAAPDMFSISGTISGATGTVVWETVVAGSILHDGGNSNGTVTFSPLAGITEGSNWSVVINTAPAGQSCEVSNGSGILTADVTDISIVCSDVIASPTTYSINGMISGASGSVIWELRKDGVFFNDGSTGNGPVSFTSAMNAGSGWSVVIDSAPAGQTCTINNGSGTLSANVTNVAITCSDIVAGPTNYSISGTVSGASGSVVWELSKDGSFFNDGGATNGAVTFTDSMASGSAWALTINTPPAGQTCSVNNGTGTLTGNVSNVSVTCENEVVTPPPTPGEALYDFSDLNLDPEIPADFTPIAPQATPVDPSGNIASLYQQLGDYQRAAIWAPVPDGVARTVTNISTGDYYEITEATPTGSWMRISSVSFGTDTTADTNDDYIMAYTIYPHGYAGMSYSFSHPGPDAQWYTEDDIAGTRNGGSVIGFPQSGLLEFEGASEGAVLMIPCLNTGADGIAFTADDYPGCAQGYQVVVLDGEGNRGQVVIYKYSGPDGLWFTNDDLVNSYVTVTTDLSIPQTVTAVYDGEGTDGLWFTEDDVVDSHIQQLLGDNYQPLYSANYNLAGSDSTWFTADDYVSGYGYYGYNDAGDLLIVANHNGMGFDGEWFTSDDFVSAMISLTDDNGNVIISANLSGMGADNKWLSGDDKLFGYSYRTYDENSHQTRNADMGNKGADGLWFTSDDLPNQSYNYWSRELNSDGRVLQQLYYDPALAPNDPAFSASQINRYTYYSADLTSNINVQLANFGADGLPLTADDDLSPYPYTVATPTGFTLYSQPGPDAAWFTADDVSSGYIVQTVDGSRMTVNERYDANDTLLSYIDYTELTLSSYRIEEYALNQSGTYDLTGYHEIEEDAYGNPLWTTWFSAAGDIESVDYTERNSDGLIIRQGWAYSAGADGIWKTADDFSYYSITEYNAAGELVLSAGEYRGSDNLWGTEDDTYYINAIYLLDTDADTLAMNNGFSAVSCADIYAGSGDIAVAVRDINGAALAGATIMLNDGGDTATTNADGLASFTGLTGTQDVHVFKDGYGYESFLCVSPGLEVTLHSELEQLGVAADRSKVSFYNSVSGNFILMLLDDDGLPVHENERFSMAQIISRGTYADLYFNMAPGTDVSGQLWAFQVENGVVTSAEDLGLQTYTTIAVSTNPIYTDREQLAINFTASDLVPVALQSTTSSPVQEFVYSSASFGGLFGLDFRYDYDSYGYSAKLPGTDISLPEAQLASMAYSETWEFWQPGNLLDRTAEPLINRISSGIAYRPLISDQADNSSNPSIDWTPVSDRIEGHSAVTTLRLRSAAGGVGHQTAWAIHLPAGESSVTLPSLPAAITDTLLPEDEYTLLLETRAFFSGDDGLDYDEVVGTLDLHKDDNSIGTELIRTSPTEFGAAVLTR